MEGDARKGEQIIQVLFNDGNDNRDLNRPVVMNGDISEAHHPLQYIRQIRINHTMALEYLEHAPCILR